MSRYEPSELRPFLASLNTDAKKGLSQNFLIDGNIIRKIVKTAEVTKEDHILEVGPGPGALTEELLKTGAHVTAIEIDKHLAAGLESLKTSENNLTILQADFLQVDLPSLFKTQKGPWKVIANLPYHITTPVLMKLLPFYPEISTITVMVQKEVGERIVALPKTSNYSHFSLATQFYSKPAYRFTVEPTCFYPKPKVKSGIVQFTLHQAPLPEKERESFFRLTRTAFQKKRKMLASSLKELYDKEAIKQALGKLGLLETARPEELLLDHWIALFYALKK